VTRRLHWLLIALAVASVGLAGCGQRGPLTLREPPPADASAEPVREEDDEPNGESR
jgi:predicted small lipoprotein YifL